MYAENVNVNFWSQWFDLNINCAHIYIKMVEEYTFQIGYFFMDGEI